MNILVCIKQVPDTTEIKIDPVKNTLIREGVPSIVNPFDTYALEAAARIKDANPDAKIVVVTMGPPQAEKALRECLAIAADKAYLVTDRKFGGSDTLATSYVLRKTVEKLETLEGKFDAIFCGKQAIDGDAKAREFIRDTIGEKPMDEQKITGSFSLKKVFVTKEEQAEVEEHIADVIGDGR